MGYERDGNDPYLYPGTEVLRNLEGLKEEQSLSGFETEAVLFRHVQLLARPVPGNFDLAHLKAIHRHLFQNVYAWAGELRMVDISRGVSRFATHHFLESYSHGVFARLAEERTQWRQKGVPTDFPECLAEYLGEINAMHPFREGNGRTQRAFIGCLAAAHGFQILWEKMDQHSMTRASILSMQGDDRMLADLLGKNLRPDATAKQHRKD